MKPLFLFAHGAGAPSSHPWMQAWAARLGTLGTVHTFDYPYMRAGRKSPDRQPKLIEAHVVALADARKVHGRKRPVVLVGKSMGGRIGCHVAAEHPAEIAAVVCLGFPLGSGDKAKVRGQVLVAQQVPVLFVQGEKDSLCPLDDLARVRKRMKAPSALHVIAGGNHSLQAPKRLLAKAGRTQDDVDAEAQAAIVAFLREHLG